MSPHSPAEVSSLIALLRGDDDAPPVPHPKLVALILDGLATKEGGRWTGSVFTLCDYLFGTNQVAPKIEERYVDEVGREMWNALLAGLSLWKSSAPKAA